MKLHGRMHWDYLALNGLQCYYALAAGAYGGRITPSMMLGSTLAIVFGTIWSIAVALYSLGMAAFIGL